MVRDLEIKTGFDSYENETNCILDDNNSTIISCMFS